MFYDRRHTDRKAFTAAGNTQSVGKVAITGLPGPHSNALLLKRYSLPAATGEIAKHRAQRKEPAAGNEWVDIPFRWLIAVRTHSILQK